MLLGQTARQYAQRQPATVWMVVRNAEPVARRYRASRPRWHPIDTTERGGQGLSADLMPVFSGGAFLRTALSSVIGQPEDWPLLIIDDGSGWRAPTRGRRCGRARAPEMRACGLPDMRDSASTKIAMNLGSITLKARTADAVA
jgi:hypothetical protein